MYNRIKIPPSKVLKRLSQRVSERSAFVFPILWVVGYVYPTIRVCVLCMHFTLRNLNKSNVEYIDSHTILSPQNTCRGSIEIWGVFLITRSIFSINS
jgi:hypothetical protein